jgi:hypothetical protein
MLLRVDIGASVVVGDLDLHLPSGLILELSSVYFIPSIYRNIISVSCMDIDGFTFLLKINAFLFIEMVFFMAILRFLMTYMF